MAVGAINGILIAVALALARFIRQAARPRDEVLGKVEGLPGFHSIERHGTAAKTFPGLVLFQFNGPLAFFNADYFKQRALAAADAAGKDLRWFAIDAIPISDIDVNGLYALRDLNVELGARGATLRDSIRRRGQKGRHEHDEDDTRAEQFDWNDVRHEVYRITLGDGPSPTYREPGGTEQGDCALRAGLGDGPGR